MRLTHSRIASCPALLRLPFRSKSSLYPPCLLRLLLAISRERKFLYIMSAGNAPLPGTRAVEGWSKALQRFKNDSKIDLESPDARCQPIVDADSLYSTVSDLCEGKELYAEWAPRLKDALNPILNDVLWLAGSVQVGVVSTLTVDSIPLSSCSSLFRIINRTQQCFGR